MKQLICIEERTFRELCSRIEMLSQLAERLQSKLKLLHPEEWIDGEEVCRQLNISKRTLHTYRERGVLPFSSIEGKTLFRQKDIEGFLQSRTVESE
ncbi:MAG: helix-turn-helix domain-containing protein [Alistipes sp.]|jgi:hypothetical protein|uniref:helix-turn-helix domain-containing protein n=1 Tax=uncultured Bacteroides sp. TaxID=162156 RepID=UPI002613C845|nr:helix-turn-helix domain-containing protein [uncultured Bacteroides sp.]